mgnify:CR=1 FL=1
MTGRSPPARRPCSSRELLLAGMLLLLAFLFFANGLASAVRGLQLSDLVPIVLAGLAVGWLLALTRLPGTLSLLLAISTGVILVTLRIGQLEGPLLSLLREAVDLGFRVVQVGPTTQVAGLVAAWNELSSGVTSLASHLFAGVQALYRGGPSADPVFLGTIWLFASWVCLAWGSWSVRRGSVLVGLAPGALSLIHI